MARIHSVHNSKARAEPEGGVGLGHSSWSASGIVSKLSMRANSMGLAVSKEFIRSLRNGRSSSMTGLACNVPWNPYRFSKRIAQRTREGCGCFWGLCGSSGGKFQENFGKMAGKFFPNRNNLKILVFRAPGKANLPQTLGPHCTGPCANLPCGVFFEINSYSLLELFWMVEIIRIEKFKIDPSLHLPCNASYSWNYCYLLSCPSRLHENGRVCICYED